MLLLKIYSIFVMVMFLISLINAEHEDKVIQMVSFIIFLPVLITLIYGGVC